MDAANTKTHITVILNGQACQVTELTGSDNISMPFSYDITISEDEHLNTEELLGCSAVLLFQSSDGHHKKVAGLISQIDELGKNHTDKFITQLRLSSKMMLLENSSSSRVHLNTSLKSLCFHLLQDSNFHKSQIIWKVQQSFPEITYLQLEENNSEFLHRLISEHGVFYWSETIDDKEVIVFSDSNLHCPYISREAICLKQQAGMSPQLFYGCFGLSVQHNYQPAIPSTQNHGHPPIPAAEVNIANQHHYELGGLSTVSADQLSQTLKFSLDVQQTIYQFNTNVEQLSAGFCFSFIDEPGLMDRSGDYLVIATQNHAQQQNEFSSQNNTGYQKTVFAIAREVPFRSPVIARKKLPFAISATVESNSQYAHIDELGDYQSRYAFDLSDNQKTQAMPAIQKLSPYVCAGQNQATGQHFPLLDGDKVLISCLNNNPESAYIVGFVQQDDQQPVVTADNLWQNRMVSETGNELLMDDEPQAPRIILQSLNSEHKLELNAKQGAPFVELLCQFGAITVQSELSQFITTNDGNLSEKINDSRTVKVKADHSTETGGELKRQSASTISLSCENKLLTASDEHTQIKLKQGITLRGDNNIQMKADGNVLQVTAAKGSQFFQSPNNITIEGSGNGDIILENSGGGIKMDASGNVTLFGSLISMDSDKITFNGDVEYDIASPPSPPNINIDLPDTLDDIDKFELENDDSYLTMPDITSDYALNELIDLSAELTEEQFIIFTSAIFGADIPLSAYKELYNKVQNKEITPPEIVIMPNTIKGAFAGYNREDRSIYLHISLVKNAINNKPGSHQKLVIILVEEFGHHIDQLLRETLSSVGGDAENDEGAIFAYKLAFTGICNGKEQVYAHVSSDHYTGPLSYNDEDLKTAAKEYASVEEQEKDDSDGMFEFFGAGYGNTKDPKSFGHRSIELVLRDIGFDERKDLPYIYFGNWLRDFSQVVDPSIIRPTIKNNKNSLSNDFSSSIDERNIRFSRETLTKIVGVLALKEFANDGERIAEEFYRLLWSSEGQSILGCYRPEEHIDNPMPEAMLTGEEVPDYSETVADYFAPPPTEQQLAVNPLTGLKNYIATATPGQKFDTAADYMSTKLQSAMDEYKNDRKKALRYFGEALHVLEDFFSHSNFVELSLIKLGYTKVYPWVDVPSGASRIPLVTGRFGSTDIAHSILPKLVGFKPHIEPYKEVPAGVRSPNDRVNMLLLVDFDISRSESSDLNEHLEKTVSFNKKLVSSNQELDELIEKYNIPKAPNFAHHVHHGYAGRYNEYLKIRDLVNAGKATIGMRMLFEAKHYLIESILFASFYPYYLLLKPMSTLIDDGQTIHNELTETAIGTNPTHSQLAKDHDDHHFHEISAKLAMHAVKEVGKYMSLCLNSESDVSPVSVAKNFLRHPNDMATLDSIVLEWAKSNPEMINRGESRHIAEHLSKETTHIIDRVNNNLLELKQKLNSFNILKND